MEIDEWTWDDAIEDADFFYGLEVGYNWVRKPRDFDPLHLNLFYADKPQKDTVTVGLIKARLFF